MVLPLADEVAFQLCTERPILKGPPARAPRLRAMVNEPSSPAKSEHFLQRTHWTRGVKDKIEGRDKRVKCTVFFRLMRTPFLWQNNNNDPKIKSRMANLRVPEGQYTQTIYGMVCK